MNNIVANFSQILAQAQSGGIPANKARGILREYLQVKFITSLYANPAAKKLSFIGGTSLRLLHNIPRFSEDLDFDNMGVGRRKLIDIIAGVSRHFTLENIDVEVSRKFNNGITYHQLRFPKLLFDLKISTNPKEKLMIKIDYSTQWVRQKIETVLMSKYGFIEQVVTNPLSQVMVQKLTAYVTREITQPRDMYDIVWLFSQGAQPDPAFIKANRLGNLIERAKVKFANEGAGESIVRRLRPFLFNEAEISKVKLLGVVLDKLNLRI